MLCVNSTKSEELVMEQLCTQWEEEQWTAGNLLQTRRTKVTSMTSAQDSIVTLADLRLKVGNRGHFPSCKVWWDKRPDMKTPLGTLRPLFYRPSTRTRNPPEAPVQHNKTGPEFFSFQLFSRTRIPAPFEPFLQILLIYKLKLLALTQFCLSVSVLWFLVVPRCCRVHEPAVPAARLSQILLWRLVSSSTRSLHHWKLAFLTGSTLALLRGNFKNSH